MIENNNYPWYLQQTSGFSTLYSGFFPIAEAASPLGIGDAFNIDLAQGAMLYRLGTYWGMSGSPYVWDGLIYNVDNWSETKTWTGGLRQLGEEFYANLIKAKAYAYGRPYSLETLKGVFERVFEGMEYDVKIHETGTISDNTLDMGLIPETVTDTIDCELVTDAVTEEKDCGDLSEALMPINTITIVISAPEPTIRTFVEARAFDIAFIGKPVGIKVVWEYKYI